MAGDWIKMRTNLDTDWRVIEMAGHLGIPELHVVGCLWKLWTWADQHTLDGNAIRVTDVTLDRFTGVTGFAHALRKVGWLEGQDSALSFPRFAEHNGQTAKNRAETNKRVARHRNANTVTNVTPKPLPEKRREEKSIREREEAENLVINLSNSMQSAWTKWKLHSMDKGKTVNEISEQSQLMKLAQAYPDEVDRVAAIEHAIEKNWANVNLSGDHRRVDAPRPAAGKRDSESKKLFDSIFNSKEGAK